MVTPVTSTRHEALRAEPLRLRHRAARQFAAADAGRETRGSSRSANWCPPARRGRAGRAAASAGLPTRHTPRPPGRRDRRRRSPGRRRRRPPASGRPRRSATSRGSGLRSTTPSSKNRAGSSSSCDAGRVEQRPRRRVALDVEPAIRHEVARQEVLDGVRARRPLMSDQPQPRRLGQVLGLPRRRAGRRRPGTASPRAAPRLREVVIEVRVVDRLDRRVDVGVGSQQDAPRLRIDLARPREHLGAVHARHPLIADDHARHRHRAPSARAGVERLLARGRADDGVGLAVAGAQVAPHRGEHLRVVVDDQEHGLVHDRLSVAPVSASRQRRRGTPCVPAPTRPRSRRRCASPAGGRCRGRGRCPGPRAWW